MSKKPTVVRVCQNYSCVENGSESVMKKIEDETKLKPGKKNTKYDLDYACCLGCCDFGPNMLVNDNLVLGAKTDTVMEQIDEAALVKSRTQKEKEENLNKILDE
jgi:NADH:ubiquinone oxidoreductase subunit E